MARFELGPLREREFRLLFAATLLTQMGGAMAPIALAFGVLDLTGSVTGLGVVLAAGAVPFVALVLVGGVLADRISRLRVMAVSGAVAGASQGATAALFLSGHARVWELALLAAVQGSARAFGGPAMGALIPDTVGADRLQQATALMYACSSGVDVGGAAVGGFVVAAIGPGWAMGLNAASSFGEVGLRALMRVGSQPPQPERRAFRHEFGEGLRAVTDRRWLWVMLVSAAAFALAVVAPWDVLGPALARSSLGGPAAWGVIESGYSLGALAGGLAVVRLRFARPLLVAALLCLL